MDMEEERVWVRFGDATRLFKSKAGKLDVGLIAGTWNLSVKSLCIGPDAIEVDEGLSVDSIASIRKAAVEVGAGDGRSKETAFDLQGALAPSPVPPLDERGINWTEVLTLSSEEVEFLDKFLCGEYSLKEMDTGVAMVPVFDFPSMLLFDLGHKFTHADLLEQALAYSFKRVVVVAGASGCGKTSLLYDLFSRNDGFYFVMTTELNPGSNDMSDMIDALKPFLIAGDKSRANGDVVEVFTTILLACRMVIYQYMKKKGADPRQWMLLQAACRRIGPGKDVFCSFFQRARRNLPVDRSGVLLELGKPQKVVDRLFGWVSIPMVAIDEAQLAMLQLSDSYFWCESRSCWLPANPLVQSFQLNRSFNHILVTGTGCTLHLELETLAWEMTLPPIKFTSFSGWGSPDQMVKFAERVTKLSEDDLSLLSSTTWGIFPRFRGRFRPFCEVLECMLLKQMSLSEASAYVIAAQTTKAGNPEFPMKFLQSSAESAMGDEMPEVQKPCQPCTKHKRVRSRYD